jgi:hypothetical protein
MSRLAALGTLCLLLSGCAYYPPYGYGYAPPPPAYRYYGPPPAYAYPAPAPAYPYAAPYAAQPYASGMPQTLGPSGDTSGATGN